MVKRKMIHEKTKRKVFKRWRHAVMTSLFCCFFSSKAKDHGFFFWFVGLLLRPLLLFLFSFEWRESTSWKRKWRIEISWERRRRRKGKRKRHASFWRWRFDLSRTTNTPTMCASCCKQFVSATRICTIWFWWYRSFAFARQMGLPSQKYVWHWQLRR